jgi:hypothetical protein
LKTERRRRRRGRGKGIKAWISEARRIEKKRKTEKKKEEEVGVKRWTRRANKGVGGRGRKRVFAFRNGKPTDTRTSHRCFVRYR